MSGDKPKNSAYVTQYKLISESIYWPQLEDKLETGQEISTTIEDLIMVKSNIPELTNNLLYYIAENEAMEEALFNEIERLKERKDRFKKKAQVLREAIKTVMSRCEIKKMICPLATISLSVRMDSKLDVTDEGALISEYPELYIMPEPKLDRVELRKRLSSGERIRGANLVNIEVLNIRK